MISNLSLEPVMIEAKNSIIAEEIDFFDEQNLVRWDGDRFFELQYLIRNVSRSNMSEDERKAIHETLAAHWLIQESKGLKRIISITFHTLICQISSANYQNKLIL